MIDEMAVREVAEGDTIDVFAASVDGFVANRAEIKLGAFDWVCEGGGSKSGSGWRGEWDSG